MKKKLIDSCRVRPYTSGAAIDRQNFGSAVLAGHPTERGVQFVT